MGFVFIFDFDGTFYSGEHKFDKVKENIDENKRIFLSHLSDDEYDLICKVTKNGVEITAEGKGELEILLPLFWFDGKTYTEIWGTKNKAEVLYKNYALTYSSRNKMEMTENMYANRSGYYKSAKVSGKNKVTVKIKMKKVKK